MAEQSKEQELISRIEYVTQKWEESQNRELNDVEKERIRATLEALTEDVKDTKSDLKLSTETVGRLKETLTSIEIRLSKLESSVNRIDGIDKHLADIDAIQRSNFSDNYTKFWQIATPVMVAILTLLASQYFK